MKVVGLTGGIGSGKSTVARMFIDLGIPVYIADEEAKKLMNTSKTIRKQLINLLGEESFKSDSINREYIASKVFNNKDLLQEINAIVHPKVSQHFSQWLQKQSAPYIIKEAAIIFENNLQSQYDFIVTVVADQEARINRILKRDGSSRERIESIMKNQMPDKDKIALSHFVIYNSNLEETANQASIIHNEILNSLH